MSGSWLVSVAAAEAQASPDRHSSAHPSPIWTGTRIRTCMGTDWVRAHSSFFFFNHGSASIALGWACRDCSGAAASLLSSCGTRHSQAWMRGSGLGWGSTWAGGPPSYLLPPALLHPSGDVGSPLQPDPRRPRQGTPPAHESMHQVSSVTY